MQVLWTVSMCEQLSSGHHAIRTACSQNSRVCTMASSEHMWVYCMTTAHVGMPVLVFGQVMP